MLRPSVLTRFFSLLAAPALANAEHSLARTLTPRVTTARAGLTFAELVARSPLGKHTEGRFQVINGLYPAGEPVAGQARGIVE